MADNWCCYPPFLLKYCEAVLVQCFSPANVNDDRSINTEVHRKSTQTDQYVLLTLTSYWSTSWESSKPGTARTYPQGCEERNKERSREAVKPVGTERGISQKPSLRLRAESMENVEKWNNTFTSLMLQEDYKLEYPQKWHLVHLTPCNILRETQSYTKYVFFIVRSICLVC